MKATTIKGNDLRKEPVWGHPIFQIGFRVAQKQDSQNQNWNERPQK
jgi:hypothetical protein